jgi:hypothetical protein
MAHEAYLRIKVDDGVNPKVVLDRLADPGTPFHSAYIGGQVIRHEDAAKANDFQIVIGLRASGRPEVDTLIGQVEAVSGVASAASSHNPNATPPKKKNP